LKFSNPKTKSSERIVYSFVVDSRPRYGYQAFHLAKSLIEHCGAHSDTIHVHMTRGVSAHVRRTFAELGCSTHALERFGDGKYCNKIAQLENLLAVDFEQAVLVDTDMIAVSDIRPALTDHFVQGKIVDLPNPSLTALAEIGECAGLATLPSVVETDAGCGQTYLGNCNGGLYVIPKAFARTVSEQWRRWALHLLDHPEVLRREGKEAHIDQVGMWLTIWSAELPFKPVPSNANYYVHFSGRHVHFDSGLPISLIHYHQTSMNAQGLIDQPEGSTDVQSNAIASANRQIEKSFNDELFWEFRYGEFPELGSGIGSRGEILAEKRRLLEPFASVFCSTIDIGCGDLEATRNLSFPDYLGVDKATTALSLSAEKDVHREFISLDSFLASARRSELVLCLDVLIHQNSRTEYEQLLALALERAESLLLISGFDGPPVYSSHITRFFEPLSQTLSTHSISRVERLGSYRDLTLFAVVIEGGALARNAVQMPLAELVRAFHEVPYPDRLIELYRLGLNYLGFFTNHYPRVFEYSWLCEQSNNLLEESNILDIGAGVSPLPLWFAERRCRVVTVDNHELDRTGSNVATWNEWGFLDYASLHSRITSRNCDMLDVTETDFDLIYSVSVIEHLPAETRRQFFSGLRRILRPGGVFLATIDLVPGTDELWNMSEGRTVEERSLHGTIEDVMAELSQAGLTIRQWEVRRELHGARVDLGFFQATMERRWRYEATGGSQQSAGT
jgi:2-polyprenyl-3-methyl-5-hydroxy-6-metoxy-1,4-benzoquinol methylase